MCNEKIILIRIISSLSSLAPSLALSFSFLGSGWRQEAPKVEHGAAASGRRPVVEEATAVDGLRKPILGFRVGFQSTTQTRLIMNPK